MRLFHSLLGPPSCIQARPARGHPTTPPSSSVLSYAPGRSLCSTSLSFSSVPISSAPCVVSSPTPVIPILRVAGNRKRTIKMDDITIDEIEDLEGNLINDLEVDEIRNKVQEPLGEESVEPYIGMEFSIMLF